MLWSRALTCISKSMVIEYPKNDTPLLNVCVSSPVSILKTTSEPVHVMFLNALCHIFQNRRCRIPSKICGRVEEVCSSPPVSLLKSKKKQELYVSPLQLLFFPHHPNLELSNFPKSRCIRRMCSPLPSPRLNSQKSILCRDFGRSFFYNQNFTWEDIMSGYDGARV
jgi:hypothetical protein